MSAKTRTPYEYAFLTSPRTTSIEDNARAGGEDDWEEIEDKVIVVDYSKI